MVHVGYQVVSTSLAILIAVSCLGAEGKRPAKRGLARMGPIVRASAPRQNIRQIWAYADPKDGLHMIACGMLSFAAEERQLRVRLFLVRCRSYLAPHAAGRC